MKCFPEKYSKHARQPGTLVDRNLILRTFFCFLIRSQLEIFLCITRTPSFSRRMWKLFLLFFEFFCFWATIWDTPYGLPPLTLRIYMERTTDYFQDPPHLPSISCKTPAKNFHFCDPKNYQIYNLNYYFNSPFRNTASCPSLYSPINLLQEQ